MRSTVSNIAVEIWQYPGKAGWHFASLPKKLSREIKAGFGDLAAGWGSLPVWATIGKTRWATSIFPDSKSAAYLLPIKVEVRKRERIKRGDRVVLTLGIRA
jgi:hypothetical protein